MDSSSGDMSPGHTLLRTLKALAITRGDRGDIGLVLNPSTQPQEYNLSEEENLTGNGLVLEPREGADFEICNLGSRKPELAIGAFCDGTRETYFLGHEGVYPLLYTENQAVVRCREPLTGYHCTYLNVHRLQSSLLAPFDLFAPSLQRIYRSLGLITNPYADLCRAADDSTLGLTKTEQARLNSSGWQKRGQRRARFLMERTEERVALIAAALLRHQYPNGSRWLLKDGPLTQFDRRYLRHHREKLRSIVGCVKNHPVPFFGAKGERALASMAVGERSVAFMPRPEAEAAKARNGASNAPNNGSLLDKAYRPMVSWYLRVHPPTPGNARLLSGVVRLDIAAFPDWPSWVDALSWAVLDEFHGLSARPDERYDVLAYGIHDCELFMSTKRLSSEFLLAGMTR